MAHIAVGIMEGGADRVGGESEWQGIENGYSGFFLGFTGGLFDNVLAGLGAAAGQAPDVEIRPVMEKNFTSVVFDDNSNAGHMDQIMTYFGPETTEVAVSEITAHGSNGQKIVIVEFIQDFHDIIGQGAHFGSGQSFFQLLKVGDGKIDAGQ